MPVKKNKKNINKINTIIQKGKGLIFKIILMFLNIYIYLCIGLLG